MTNPYLESDALRHWKYIDREWKKGRWVYTYPREGQKTSAIARVYMHNPYNIDPKTMPDSYNPNLKETTSGGKKGYVDEGGMFFEGDLHTAKVNKYIWDANRVAARTAAAKKQAAYNGSAKKVVDDTIENWTEAGTKLVDAAKDAIDKGKSFLEKLFKKG